MTDDQYRAVPAPAYEGKPAWHGQWRDAAGDWHTAESSYGKIIYTSPEYAVQGARTAAEQRG
jgi:hypothetical protein